MNINDILNNNSDTPLTLEELDLLKKEKYIVNKSTPSRIRRNKQYVNWACKNYPKEVAEYLLETENPVINDYTYRAFASNTKLLRKSLEEDFDRTMHILIKHGAKIEDVNGIRDILLSKDFYVEDGEMNYFIHVNPELINISLINHFNVTVYYLNKNRVLTKPEQMKEFIEIFENNNYVITPGSLNVALRYRDLLKLSLKNNEIETLSTRVYEVLEAIKDDDELYAEYLSRIQKYLLKPYDYEEAYYIDEMMYALNFENELLFDCLNDRENHNNFLEKLSDCPIFLKLDESNSKRLHETLKDINFNVENHSPELLKKNINFLLASLDNDYLATTDYLINKYNEKDLDFIKEISKEHISEEEYQRYKDILIRNNFMNNRAFYTYVDANALRVLSEVDVNKAIAVMGIIEADKPFVIPAKTGARILKNIIDREGEIDKNNYSDDIYYRLMPSITVARESRYSNWMSEEEIDYVIEAFNKGIIPMSFIPNGYFNSSYFMDNLNINEDIKKLKKIAYKLYTYDPEDEKALLRVLNKNTLQDAIMPLKDKKRSELSIEEMFAIKMYGAKILSGNGLKNYSFDIFGYNEDYNELGSENNYSYYIELYNGHNRKVYDMIKTIHHEVNHAIQFKNVNEANFEEDEDINDYAKDDLLRDMFDTYYEDNYNSISYEYDTEMKAVMLTDAFFDNQVISKEYLQHIYYDLKYDRSRFRVINDKNYKRDHITLEELFDEMIMLRKFDLNDIKSRYKCLEYEYSLESNPIHKYSIMELIDKIQSNLSIEEREKYLSVLKRQLDERKCKKYKENREELLKLDELGLIDKKIAHEVNLYNPIFSVKNTFHKYLSYLDSHFDRINKLLTKKKKDKNNSNI